MYYFIILFVCMYVCLWHYRRSLMYAYDQIKVCKLNHKWTSKSKHILSRIVPIIFAVDAQNCWSASCPENNVKPVATQVLSSATLVSLIESLTWPQSSRQFWHCLRLAAQNCETLTLLLTAAMLCAVRVDFIDVIVVAVAAIGGFVFGSWGAGRLLTLFRPRLQ